MTLEQFNEKLIYQKPFLNHTCFFCDEATQLIGFVISICLSLENSFSFHGCY